MTNLWNFVDKFRPVLKDHKNISMIFKSRMFILINWFIILFCITLAFLGALLDLNIRIEMAIFLSCQGILFFILHKKFNIVGLLMLTTTVSFLGYSVYIIIQGGAYINTLIYWYPVVPLLVTFIGGRWYGAVSIICVYLSIYIIYDSLHMNGLILREGLNFERFVVLQSIHLVAMSSFVFVLAMIFIGTHNALEKNVLRVKSKMEENSKSFLISRMSAGISHEINNPLCAIRFANEVIKMCTKKEDFDKEKMLKMVERIDSSIDRAVVVVDALKSIGANSEEKKFSYVSIAEIVADVERMYKTEMIINKIDFLILNETLMSEKIFIYKEKVIEALIHIINNAVFETKNFPEEERKISFKIDQVSSYYSFAVTDPGKGIENNIESKMFDPFYTNKDVNVGMGLGLTLASAIARTHSGKLEYGLTDGNTTFTLCLGII